MPAVADRLRSIWTRYGNVVLVAMAAWMAVTAFLRLRYAFYLLVILEAAVDLKARTLEVQHWFSGARIYGVLEYAEYPPASYMMLWPLVGWLTRTAASWLWGVVLAASIAVLAFLCVRASGASTWQQRVFMALLPLPLYATQMTAWFGQLGVQVTALLLAGLLLLHGRPASWGRDLLAAGLLVLSLVKPTIAAPFYWLVLFVPSSIRPAALVVSGYLVLTLVAVSFQPDSVVTVMQQWLGEAGSPHAVLAGYTNVHKWLTLAGLESMLIVVSLVLLATLGAWTRHHRTVDIWILLGVAALTARLWTDHRPHDDILLLVPMIALFRLAATSTLAQGVRTWAALLLGGIVLASLAPYWLVDAGAWKHAPQWIQGPALSRLVLLNEIGQTTLWIATLGFLLSRARHAHAARRAVAS